MTTPETSAMSSLSTWDAMCKDCRNIALRSQLTGSNAKKAKDDLRQEKYEYSDVHATRQFERGQSRSDRCPECRKRHKKEIAAFPVAYIDITAIGEASKYVTDQKVGPTGPLGGLGPLPTTHNRRTESVNLKDFALGLTDEHMVELLKIMAENQVVVLEAGTGTGKSTLAPFRLMNPPPGAPYRPTDIGPIVVTEPRVPATTEVAQFVGEAMCFGHDPETCFAHVGPGYPVGYQCEGKKVWDEACSLIYVTDGTMVNWITNGDLARIGTVVVDEAHERSDNIDTILTLLAAKLPRYPHLRVVIASATIDKTYFMRFFEQTPSIRVGHYYVEAKKQIGYGVPLFGDVDFTEQILEHGFAAKDPNSPDAEPRFTLPGWPDEPNVEEGGKTLRALTRDLYLGIRHPAPNWPNDVVEAAVAQTMKILTSTDQGDVLVFLPNKKMVQDAQADIQAAVEDAAGPVGTVHVYWLMRETPKKDKKIALASCAPGERKVVVASNLAETSLTIAGIKYVVDSGLVIQAEWDPDLAVSHAPLKPHSQSGIRQRWGRVGRKTHGWVFPLYSLGHYLAMPRDTPAGSTQVNLENTMLKIIAAGEDPNAVVFPADFEAEGVTRDSSAQHSAANFKRERARALAALQINGAVHPDARSLTRLGSELTRSRVSPEKAIALMFADRLACVPEVATVLVALAGREDNERDKGRLAGPGRMLASDRKWPVDWNVHARRCHETLAIGCVDDIDLVIRIFAEWKAAPDSTAWCDRWWVNEDVLCDLETAAGKLMDSLAPGMSKEVKRPLDPRLAGRARAVLSRALGSLRYRRTEGMWQSANPDQPDPVGISPLRLIPPASDLIALIRERPNDQWAGPVSRHGELLGLVSWLSWAAERDPTDFELLRRVSLRRDELERFSDPGRAARAEYPIGARVEVTGGTSGNPTVRKLTDGLAKPVLLEPRDDDPEDSEGTESALVYTSETVSSGDSSPDRAGVEVPEEELRLVPIPIAQLEHPEIEDFSGRKSGERVASTITSASGASHSLTVGVSGARRDAAGTWYGVVRAYELEGDRVQLVIDPVPDWGRQRREIGEVVRSVVVGSILTHVGAVCELRECDEDGNWLVGEPFYVRGATIDNRIREDAEALAPGSVWECRVIATPSDFAATKYSVASAVFDRVASDTAATAGVRDGTVAIVAAVLTGETYRDRRGGEYVVAATTAFDPELRPRFAIWKPRLERAGIGAIAGSRVKLDLGLDRYARRSGRWKSGDVNRLADQYPDLFEAGSQPEFVSLKNDEVLSDEGLNALLDIDPASVTYEGNAWQLWETSHVLAVRRVSAVGEADLAPEAASALRTSGNVSDLRKRYSVGIAVGDDGRVSISGDAPNVIEALDALKSASTAPTTAIQIPARPDGKFPKFPGKPEVAAALADLGDLADELVDRYVPSAGRLILGSEKAVQAATRIRTLLTSAVQFHSVRLTFAERRGFYAFQSKARWTSIAAAVPGLQRWLIEDCIVWGLFASDAIIVSAGLAQIRAALPAVPFSISATEALQPSILQIPPLTDRFNVSYVSPGTVPPAQSSGSIHDGHVPSGQVPPSDGDRDPRLPGRLSVRDRLQKLSEASAAALSADVPEAPQQRPVRAILKNLRARLSSLDHDPDRRLS